MKRWFLLICLLCLFTTAVSAVQPLTSLELSNAEYDAVNDLYLVGDQYYDGFGYPVILSDDSDVSTEVAADMDSDDELLEDDAIMIHSEDTGDTQVNVFAIQTSDETGGTWIMGGSGNSLTEQLFGEYIPYNAAGIASVDWAWIADVVLFAILVICFFKIVAGVIKRV